MSPPRPLRRALTLLALLAGAAAAAARPAPTSAPPAPLVVILGDSIAAGLGLPSAAALPSQLQEALAARGAKARVIAAAVSGDTTGAALDRLDFSVPSSARICVIELGGNDYLQAAPPSEILAHLRAILSRLKARGVQPILAASAAPKGSSGPYGRAFDRVFPTAARQEKVPIVPNLLDEVLSRPNLRQGDGLHPNAAGVKIMAALLAGPVAAALGR